MKKKRIQILCSFVCVTGLCMGQNGFTQYRYPNGQVSSEGHLVNGTPEGYWKSWYENGVIKSEGNRTSSLLDSTWKFYDESGKLTTEIAYAGGKKNGLTRKFGEDGSLVSEEPFVNDVKEGEARTYYPNGALHERSSFKQGVEDGKAYEYATDGRIITIYDHRAGMLRSKETLNRFDEQGWKQGFWREYWPNGKPKLEGRYVDDKRQGIFKEYDVNGALKTMEKFDQDEIMKDAEEVKMLAIKNTYHSSGKVASIGSYSKDGKKEGLFRNFGEDGKPTTAAIYQSGQKMSEGAVNDVGALQGNWTEYYGSGEKRAEGGYKDGKKDGPWTFYHRTGEVEQRGNYVNGLPQGEWVWFFPSGARHREEHYRKGKEDGASVEYDSTGAVITQGEYIDGLKDGPWIYHVGDHTETGAYKDGLRDGENIRLAMTERFVQRLAETGRRWSWLRGGREVRLERADLVRREGVLRL
ncbi:MAG TPA: toxin-antitoxin system YwqK family antitoxin, partial [Flavobacteriales bacterium]|nr:toxin-antitoxin system YwqK family antitoxin [Flavobacteriales bacterium]